MTGDRDRGLETLRYWYRASGFQLRGVSFEDAISHYDGASPTFLEGLGGAVRVGNMPSDRVNTAMQALASSSTIAYPWHGSFFDALVGERLAFRYEDAVDVAKETANDVATAAAAGLGIYLAVGGAVLALAIFASSRKASST